jgi:hypothetical protein
MRKFCFDRAVDMLKKHGFVIIESTVFHKQAYDQSIWRNRLDALLSALEPVDDQIGSLRYHLSGPAIEQLLEPWLCCKAIESLSLAVIGCDQLQVNYIRYREPLYGRGLQKLHRDWDSGHPGGRLEMFIAFDKVTSENGCTELIDYMTGTKASIYLEPGSVLLINSSVLHRGTRNRSGRRRRVVSLQIGPLGGIGSEFVCMLPPRIS